MFLHICVYFCTYAHNSIMIELINGDSKRKFHDCIHIYVSLCMHVCAIYIFMCVSSIYVCVSIYTPDCNMIVFTNGHANRLTVIANVQGGEDS